jgi:hypothetical protein
MSLELLIENKDLLWTLILLPFLWFFVRNQSKSFEALTQSLKEHWEEDIKVNKEVNETLINLNNSIKRHDENEEKHFEIIRENIWRVTLDKEQTIDLLKTQMWYVTSKKLEFIKGIILNNHITWNEDKIREKIYTWLARFSDEYLSKFTTYKTPIWDLSKWLINVYPETEFNKLVNECVTIIYKKYEWNESDNTLNKINEIAMIMRTLQVWLANKLRSDIYKI